MPRGRASARSARPGGRRPAAARRGAGGGVRGGGRVSRAPRGPSHFRCPDLYRSKQTPAISAFPPVQVTADSTVPRLEELQAVAQVPWLEGGVGVRAARGPTVLLPHSSKNLALGTTSSRESLILEGDPLEILIFLSPEQTAFSPSSCPGGCLTQLWFFQA